MMKKLALLTVSALLIASICVAAEGNFLADRHSNEYGLECGDCHDKDNPPDDLIEAENCLVCHDSYDALSELTKKSNPDPHRNHMVFEDTSCGECHRAHKPPRLMCDGCHQFDLIIR